VKQFTLDLKKDSLRVLLKGGDKDEKDLKSY